MKKLFFLLLIPWLAGNAIGQTTEAPLTVCQILERLTHYRNRLVRVKGILGGSAYHGLVFGDHMTDESCVELEAAGKEWPSDVRIAWASSRNVEGGPPRFKFDSERLKQHLDVLLSAITRPHPAPAHKSARITVTAEVRTRRRLEIWKEHDLNGDFYMGNGYGPGGQYPALFVIAEIHEWELIDPER